MAQSPLLSRHVPALGAEFQARCKALGVDPIDASEALHEAKDQLGSDLRRMAPLTRKLAVSYTMAKASGICAIDQHHSVLKSEIDMSLRLWSDGVPLGPVFKQLNVTTSHLHLKNQPITNEGRLAGRVAPRHYASSAAGLRVENESDVLDWCMLMLSKIASHRSLIKLLCTREIEGVLWIAVFGSNPSTPPSISSEIVAVATKCGMGIFVENYTVFENGAPKKLWIVP